MAQNDAKLPSPHPVPPFTVEPSPIVHHLTDGRYLYRVGAANAPLPAEKIHALKQARLQVTFERQFVPGASPADLDGQVLSWLLERTGRSGEDPTAVLEEFRLAERYNGQIYLTRGCLLLFARDPLRWHPRPGIDFVRFEGKERRFGRELNVIKRIRLDLPILKLIEEAFSLLHAHLKERSRLLSLLFEERLEYPTFAWQEAIVNAVAHRDYSITGAGVELWLFDDHLEVRSPGGPVPPVTLDMLRRGERVHSSRNPVLVRALVACGYMRELGEGIPRMIHEMERHGLYPPEFTEEGFMFTVTLRNTPVYDEETLAWLEKLPYANRLNARQKRVLAFARKNQMVFTSAEYRRVAETDRDTAYQDIRQLREFGIARPAGPRSRSYLVVPPEAPPDTLQALMPLLQEKGFITNADVAANLGGSRSRALRLLGRLVREEWLERTGRGRGARYLPGARLRRS